MDRHEDASMRRAVVTIVVVLLASALNMVELERSVVKPQRAQKCASISRKKFRQ